MKKKRVLFLPSGIGLAHVGRSCVVAKELQKRGFDVYFGVGRHGSVVLEIEKMPFTIIPEITVTTFNKSFVRLNPSIISIKMMEKFVKKELELYRTYKPDMVIADTRPSTKISTQVAHIPLIAMINVNATPFYDFNKSKVKLPYYWSKSIPTVINSLLEKEPSQKALAKIAPYFLKAISAGQLLNYNLVMVRYGQKPLSNVLKFLLGDMTLLLDLPEYRTVKNIQSNISMVGPIYWEGIRKKPKWANQVNDKTTIYVTASGTGNKKVFQKIIDFLSNEPFQVIATVGNTCTINQIKFPKREDFFITDFLPGEWIMKKADVIIFPGGSATSYQALSYGLPQIGLPINIDQEDSMNQLVRLKTAICINPYNGFTKEKILVAIKKILKNNTYKNNARKLQTIISKSHSVKKAGDVIENFIDSQFN